MNKKHQQAFRELREWCIKHEAHIYRGEDGSLMIQVGRSFGAVYYTISKAIDEDIDRVEEVHYTFHSISSEAEDE